VVLTDQGEVYSIGDNEHGQCGVGNNTKLRTNVEQGGMRINSFVAISRNVFESDVVDISCGEFHTVFVCKNGNVFTCGLDSKWQLGHAVFPPIPGDTDEEQILYEHRHAVIYDHRTGWRDTPTKVELPMHTNFKKVKSLFKGVNVPQVMNIVLYWDSFQKSMKWQWCHGEVALKAN